MISSWEREEKKQKEKQNSVEKFDAVGCIFVSSGKLGLIYQTKMEAIERHKAPRHKAPSPAGQRYIPQGWAPVHIGLYL